MRFLSIYKSAETGLPPTREEMATMGKLIEDGMKAGYLVRWRAACQARPARVYDVLAEQ